MKYKDYKHSEDFKTADTVELYDKAGAVIEIISETKRQKLNNHSSKLQQHKNSSSFLNKMNFTLSPLFTPRS